MAEVGEDGTVHMAAGATTGALAGTAIMPGIGTVVGAGLGLLGGWLGSSSQKKQAEKQIAFQREAMQNTLQWRVEDAKKAGIHPLYGIGAPSFSPSPIMYQDPLPQSVAEAGQDIGRAIQATQTTRDKLVDALQLDILQSEAAKKKSEANIMMQQELAGYQAGNNQNGLGIHNENEQVNPMGQVPAVRGTEIPGAAEQGWYERKAPQRMSPSAKMPGWESQYGPAYQEWEIFPGFYLSTPMTGQESWREVLSEMSSLEKFGLINQNASIYGSGWFQDFVNWEYFGIKPRRTYKPVSESAGKPKIPRGQRGRDLLK